MLQGILLALAGSWPSAYFYYLLYHLMVHDYTGGGLSVCVFCKILKVRKILADKQHRLHYIINKLTKQLTLMFKDNKAVV